MEATFIDTNKCPKQSLSGASGQLAEIVNATLCGAKNVTGTLRWLDRSEAFDADPLSESHQLLYLMEGDGVISLEGKEYPAGKGTGIYLAPGEGASIRNEGSNPLKALHLIVPSPA